MRIDADDLKRVCHGRWTGIYDRMDIDVGIGLHMPCPNCGGKDRFRFDDKDGGGEYFCSGCGPGSGFSLVMKTCHLSFPDTLKRIADVIGYIPPDKNKPFVPAKDPAIRLNELWKSSKPLKNGDPVMLYLNSRGIKEIPLDVRFCPECWEPDTKRNYFAMVAMVRDKAGEPVTLHRTYLDGKGGKAGIEKPKKLMPGKKNISGCAIRLREYSEVLGITEGIETALTCRELYGIPVWAAISAGGMASFDIPDGVEAVEIFIDNDENYTGHKAGYTLAHRAAVKGIGVSVYIPGIFGDFNDVLMAHNV